MRKFLLRRFAFLIPQLFVVSFLAFLLIKLLPGDPVLIILGPLRTQEGVIRETERLGLDKPFFVQYGKYLERTVQGDFGNSIRNQAARHRRIGAARPGDAVADHTWPCCLCGDRDWSGLSRSLSPSHRLGYVAQ